MTSMAVTCGPESLFSRRVGEGSRDCASQGNDGIRKRDPPVVETKVCRHCEVSKPVTEFPPNRRCSDGLSSWCRECHREAVRRSYRKDAAKYNERRRARRQKERGAK